MPKQIIRFTLFLFLILMIGFQPCMAQNSEDNKEKPKIGLVLSGGGARGFAHIGVIKVLEEEGIDVDVIGGTSMGSIVGGLYAMGYSIYDIEQMAINQDWDYALSDKVKRRDLGFYEKYDDETHIFSLALKGRKISIPPGLMYGQNVSHLLTQLTNPAFQVQEFKDLEKPFLCMATDLLTGQAVKLDTGNLAIALRASMSVPSAFAPVEYGPYYLVDGGVINNFPAKEVKEMGADLLIGIDIQTPLYKQEDINNLVQVLSQSIFLNAEESFNKNMELIDLLIKPDIDPFTSMDFHRADSLIRRGEQKTREMLPEIRAFLKKNGISPGSVRGDQNAFPVMDVLYVDKVILRGNIKVRDEYVLDNLDIHSGDQIRVSVLDERINRLFGTKLFHTVSYELDFSEQGETIIKVTLEEASRFDINVGAHYNDYSKAALLLNLTGRNFGAGKGRLSADLILGRVPRFGLAYVVDNGLKIGYGSDINWFQQYGYLYDETGKRIISLDIGILNLHGYGLLTFKNLIRFRLGFELGLNNISQNLSVIDFDNLGSANGNLFADLFIDTYDKLYFPKKGLQFGAVIDLGTGENQSFIVGEDEELEYFYKGYTYYSFSFHAEGILPLSNNFVLKPIIIYRKAIGDELPLTESSYLGGFQRSYIASYVPFAGYEFMELEGHTVIYPALNLRYNFWEKHYLTASARMLSLDLNFDKAFEDNLFYYSYQLSYSYESPFGPVTISMAKAYPKNKMVYDLSLGFWF